MTNPIIVVVSEVKTIKHWLAPEDRVLANVAETTSHLAQDREELTCLWVGPYLTRFLKNTQYKSLSLAGKPGSGKTVLASVIVDHLQHPIGGVSYQTLFVPISKFSLLYLQAIFFTSRYLMPSLRRPCSCRNLSQGCCQGYTASIV